MGFRLVLFQLEWLARCTQPTIASRSFIQIAPVVSLGSALPSPQSSTGASISGGTSFIGGGSVHTGSFGSGPPAYALDVAADRKSRQRFISKIGGATKLHALPVAGRNNYLTWCTRLFTELRSLAWRPNGQCITSFSTTDLSDPWMVATSANLATVLANCALANSNTCHAQLLSGQGKHFLVNELGVELWHCTA